MPKAYREHWYNSGSHNAMEHLPLPMKNTKHAGVLYTMSTKSAK